MKVKKAIIPAAGLGTRFLPATKAQPKEMLPIVDKPAIQYIVEEAVESGIEDILIITGRNKRAIEDHFDKSVELELALDGKNDTALLNVVRDISDLVDIHYVRQKEPRGLGHAVWCARKFIGNEPFAVLLGDDIIYSEVPCLLQMMNCYNGIQGSILGINEVPWTDVSRYGIIDVNLQEDNFPTKVRDIVEKPLEKEAPTNLAVMGRYILEPEIFDILEYTGIGRGGEIQLTDGIKTLLESRPVYAYEFEGIRYDVGQKLGFLKATVEFALRNGEIKEPFYKYLNEIVESTGNIWRGSGEC